MTVRYQPGKPACWQLLSTGMAGLQRGSVMLIAALLALLLSVPVTAAPAAEDYNALANARAATMLQQVRDQSNLFQSRLQEAHQAVADMSPLEPVWGRMTDYQSHGLLKLVLLLIGMVAVGYVLERLVSWRMQPVEQRLRSVQSLTWSARLGYLGLRVILDLIRVVFFALGAWVWAISSVAEDNPMRVVMLAALPVAVTLRLVAVLSRAIFAPHARGIRALPLACEPALSFHRWVLGFTLVAAANQHGLNLLLDMGMPEIYVSLLEPVSGMLMNLIALGCVLHNRVALEHMFDDGSACAIDSLRRAVLQAWPVMAGVWLFVLWLVWSYNIFIGNFELAQRLALAWWLTIVFPLVDRLFNACLRRLITLPFLQSRTFRSRSERFIRILQNGLRLIMLSVAVLTLLEVLGYGTWQMMENSVAHQLGRAVIDVLVIALVAYVAWEMIQSLIERHLPDEYSDEGSAHLEGEGGSGGASRTETLLPLLRSFILVILVVTTVLSMLNAVGVQIGPLLAGAGVVGIAVGFGAQKLVQDIISGVFFLVDDAFRRGEYIEVAGLKGTVEKIALRSMRLRHHLGAVQTIPYSEISTVKNLSRDWVTMKLEFRLPYDTDVEKVRKIVKKVGEKMLEDEEMGPCFLLPLKSQGVMRVEESALIFRMKFTTKPGEQWVIRREAYRLVKEALENNGISFAHRAVHVLLPGTVASEESQTEQPELPMQQQIVSAASAMAATLAAEDARRHERFDDIKEGHGDAT
ncbi:mechanosensitive ion channel family protein [Pokkaliibacter plantistimulans]|uniref:Mechanosensitive ion channel family protein n=1 Tax=Proteobacteria bacterium 228 TaxID=2083153 RepID=A0A2S5KS24_9PROT|nr:mechanosensitive ion channel family protein [Pokkaliibacter plantistimulans]PPC77530.1 mechanosensitive ion channel family protein [Pokkaliibacter plantistimulans]